MRSWTATSSVQSKWPPRSDIAARGPDADILARGVRKNKPSPTAPTICMILRAATILSSPERHQSEGLAAAPPEHLRVLCEIVQCPRERRGRCFRACKKQAGDRVPTEGATSRKGDKPIVYFRSIAKKGGHGREEGRASSSACGVIHVQSSRLSEVCLQVSEPS